MTKRELITLLRSDCDHKRHSCAEVGCVMAKVIPEVERLYRVEARLREVVTLATGYLESPVTRGIGQEILAAAQPKEEPHERDARSREETKHKEK